MPQPTFPFAAIKRFQCCLVLLASATTLASCGLPEDLKTATKDMVKEISKAVPFENLDITVQTLYALREGKVDKAIELQEEKLALLVGLSVVNNEQAMDIEQKKTIALAKAYLQKYPPKPQ